MGPDNQNGDAGEQEEDKFIPFIANVPAVPGQVILHKEDKKIKGISAKQIRDDVASRMAEILEVFQNNVGTIEEDFSVDEIAFSLGFGAKGKLAFIAEASTEAVLSVTLRRNKLTSDA